jgi:hypothetical protein
VVQQLELRRLVDAATQADAVLVFRVGVVDFLHEAAPLADLLIGDLPDRVVRAAVIRGAERPFDQDPMLAVRVLADIGLRALSPAVNDPTTAVDAIDATESLLRAVAGRQRDIADIADRSGVPRVRLVLHTWEDYLRTGVEDLLPPAPRIPVVWSACDGCSPTCSRCPRRRGTPRSSGSASRSRPGSARADRHRRRTPASPEPRAPREPEQSVPKAPSHGFRLQPHPAAGPR